MAPGLRRQLVNRGPGTLSLLALAGRWAPRSRRRGVRIVGGRAGRPSAGGAASARSSGARAALARRAFQPVRRFELRLRAGTRVLMPPQSPSARSHIKVVVASALERPAVEGELLELLPRQPVAPGETAVAASAGAPGAPGSPAPASADPSSSRLRATVVSSRAILIFNLRVPGKTHPGSGTAAISLAP